MQSGPTLPESEYERRLSAVREAMAEKGYDLFVVYADEYRIGDGFHLSNFKPIKSSRRPTSWYSSPSMTTRCCSRGR